MKTNPLRGYFGSSNAFLIGIDQYDELNQLQTAVNDVKAIAGLLEHPVHGFTINALLKNATFKDIKELVEITMPQAVSSDDRVLFYFAGHGIALDSEEGIPRGFLLPRDARRQDENSFIPMDWLYTQFSQLKCRHFLLILDCCFSGAFRWSNLSFRQVGLSKRVFMERFDRYAIDPAWQVVTSAAYDQKSLDVVYARALGVRESVKSQHSPFAQNLIDALNGAADIVPKEGPDGLITATELYLYLRDRTELQSLELTTNSRQTPGFFPLPKHDKGEFLFLSPVCELNLPHYDPQRNPYKGLASYETEDKHFFFGRARVVAGLEKQIEANPLTIVSGISGSGKSSLVKAGLLPALTEKGYHFVTFRPGEHPVDAFSRYLPPKFPKPLFIFIDQFEELITRCHQPEERLAFIQMLHALLEKGDPEVKLVLAVRSDFEPQFYDSPLAQQWQKSRFTIPPFSLEELREIIQQPALQRVLEFDPPELVDQIIEEVVQAPGAMPLLSFTLNELFEIYKREGLPRQSRLLSEEYYHQLGGVIGALQNRANEIYQQMPNEFQPTFQKAVLRMVSLKAGEAAARRVPLTELVFSNPQENARVTEIIDKMVTARLIVKGVGQNGHPYIEPAHDALIRSWGKLWQWISDFGQETVFLQDRLSIAVRDYQENDKAEHLLFHDDPRLDQLKAIRDSSHNWLNKNEEEFIGQSLIVRTRKRRRFIRNLFMIIFSLLTLSVTATALGLRANNKSKEARSETLTTRSVFEFQKNKNSTIAFRLAQRALGVMPSDNARQAFFDAVFQSTDSIDYPMYITLRHNGKVNSIDIGPGGQYVLTASDDRAVRLWDKYGNREQIFDGHQAAVRKAIFSPDGESIFSISDAARVWNTSGTLEQTLAGSPEGIFTENCYSPDGRYLLAGNSQGKVWAWDKGGQLLVHEQLESSAINWIRFTPDGSVFLVGCFGNNHISLWKNQLDSGRISFLLSFSVPDSEIKLNEASFTTNGSHVIAGYTDGLARVWPLTGEPPVILNGHNGTSVNDVAMAPNGNFIVTVCRDGYGFMWRPSGTQIKKLSGHLGRVNGISFSADSRFMLTTSEDRTAILWDINGRMLARLVGHKDIVASPQLAPDGSFAATISYDSTARIWPLAFSPIKVIREHTAAIQDIDYSFSGNYFATTSLDFKTGWWDKTGELQFEFMVHEAPVVETHLSPNENWLLTVAFDGKARIWNLNGSQRGEIRTTLDYTPFIITTAAVASSSEIFALGILDGRVELFEASRDSAKLIAQLKMPGPIGLIAFSPAGQFLLTACEDTTAALWKFDFNTKKFHHLASLSGHSGPISCVDFSPSEDYLVTGSSDHTAILWSIRGEMIHVFNGHENGLNTACFSPDGKILLTASDEGQVKLWDLNKGKGFGSELNRWEAYKKGLAKAAFAPKGRYIFTFSPSSEFPERNVRMWNRGGLLVASFGEHRLAVSGFAVSPDGRQLVTVSDDEKVIIWPLSPNSIIEKIDSMNIAGSEN